jgi:hypothetical protein
MLQNIEAAIERCDKEVESIALASQRQAKQSMKSGTYVPDYHRYQTADDFSEAKKREAIADCYAAICDAIDKEVATIGRKMSTPASADDVATVQLALARKNISPDELVALYNRYGGNYQLAKAIEERAWKDELDFPYSTPVMDAEAAKSRARAIFNEYDAGALTGARSLLAGSIVDAFNRVDAFGHRY